MLEREHRNKARLPQNFGLFLVFMFAMLTCIKSRCASNNYTFIGISKNLVATPQKSKAPLITIGRFLKNIFFYILLAIGQKLWQANQHWSFWINHFSLIKFHTFLNAKLNLRFPVVALHKQKSTAIHKQVNQVKFISMATMLKERSNHSLVFFVKLVETWA